MRIVCGFSLRLPAESTAAVVSVWTPVPVTVAVLLSVHGPAPIRHSPWTGETSSLTSSGTVTGPWRHADELPVSLTGVLASIMTVLSTQSVHRAPSVPRCVKAWTPLPGVMTAGPAPEPAGTQSTIHSHEVALPVMLMLTVPSGEPFCHVATGFVVSTSGSAPNGPVPTPHVLGAAKIEAHDAEACAGTARKANVSTTATMRIRGFTPR